MASQIYAGSVVQPLQTKPSKFGPRAQLNVGNQQPATVVEIPLPDEVSDLKQRLRAGSNPSSLPNADNHGDNDTQKGPLPQVKPFDYLDDILSGKVNWGPIGYPVFMRTYSRRLQNTTDSPMEEYQDTVKRVIGGCQDQLGCKFSIEEQRCIAKLMMDMKCSVAGRFLWQLGTGTVDRLGLASLQNCAFIAITDPVESYCDIFDLLALGCGVGYSVAKRHISGIAPLHTNKVKIERVMEPLESLPEGTFVVPDSREGWVDLVRRCLRAFCVTGESFKYSTCLVRPKGALIKTFGGTASGPEPLVTCINEICSVLQGKEGKKLTSVDCLDIGNIIAKAVASGNVRRAALICISDSDDIPFIMAKADHSTMPPWRWTSNNSVECNDINTLPSQYWETFGGKGEACGLINMDLARAIGRLMDGGKYPDPSIGGVNPCAEQFLANYETCCLAEIFLPNITSKAELFETARLLYMICKHSLALHSHNKKIEEIVHKNMRMGIGISGYLESTEEQKGWLSSCYEYLRTYDEMYSRVHGFNPSVKITTVKPGGTLPLLAGVAPGCHPVLYKYYIRRVRMTPNSALFEQLQKNGYPTEPSRIQVGATDAFVTYKKDLPNAQSEGTPLDTTSKEECSPKDDQETTVFEMEDFESEPKTHIPEFSSFEAIVKDMKDGKIIYSDATKLASLDPELRNLFEASVESVTPEVKHYVYDHNTMIVSFPARSGENAVLSDNMSAIQQLEVIKRLQTEWSDNAVSNTVYYRPGEMKAIRRWLEEHYNQNTKTVSFLLQHGHGFDQAPYEEITAEEYLELKNRVRPVVRLSSSTDALTAKEHELDSECAGGSCPVRGESMYPE